MKIEDHDLAMEPTKTQKRIRKEHKDSPIDKAASQPTAISSLGMVSGPLLMYSCCAFGPAAGHSEVRQKAVSPDGKYVASVVAWSQGAVGCHRDWVTVDRVADNADPRSNGHVVYAQDDSHGESVAWKGPNRLVISYEIGGYGIKDPGYVTQSNSTEDGRVAIEYAIVDPPREDQQHGQ